MKLLVIAGIAFLGISQAEGLANDSESQRPVPDPTAAYVGRLFTELPEHAYGSWLVKSEHGTYAVHYVSDRNVEMLWLKVREASAGRDPLWKVVDVLVLPADSKAAGLALHSCRSELYGAGVAAIADVPSRTVRRVWGVDLSSQRFKELQDPNECAPSWGD